MWTGNCSDTITLTLARAKQQASRFLLCVMCPSRSRKTLLYLLQFTLFFKCVNNATNNSELMYPVSEIIAMLVVGVWNSNNACPNLKIVVELFSFKNYHGWNINPSSTDCAFYSCINAPLVICYSPYLVFTFPSNNFLGSFLHGRKSRLIYIKYTIRSEFKLIYHFLQKIKEMIYILPVESLCPCHWSTL